MPLGLFRALHIAIKSRLAVGLFGILVCAQCDAVFSLASERFKPEPVLANFLVAVAARAGTLKPLTDRINSCLQLLDPLRNLWEIRVGMPFEIPQLEIDCAMLPGDFRIDRKTAL